MDRDGNEIVRNESRFHGKLWTRQGPWDIYFVDAIRLGRDWLLECVAVGPRVHTMTIRCSADGGAADTAARVTSTIRDWLAEGDLRDEVYLEVPGPTARRPPSRERPVRAVA